MDQNIITEYLGPVQNFSLELRRNFLRAQMTGFPPDLYRRFKELGIDEILNTGLLKNVCLAPNYLFRIILILAQTDGEATLLLLSHLPRFILESHLGVKLPSTRFYPCQGNLISHGEETSDGVLYIERKGASFYVKKANQVRTKLTPYIGFNELKLRNLNSCQSAQTLAEMTSKTYCQFLQELILFYDVIFLGMFKASLNYAHDYAKQRMTFGKPIIKHQAISQKIADMALFYEPIYEYLNYFFETKDINLDELLSLNKFICDCADTVFQEAVQILGGHGYLQDHPIEKWMRDAQVLKISLINLMEQVHFNAQPDPK